MSPERIEVLVGIHCRVDGPLELVGVLLDPAAALVLELHDVGELFPVDALLVVNVTAGIGKGHHLGSEFEKLLGGELGYVAASRNQADFPLEGFVPGGQHLRREVDRSVAGRLGPDERAAPVQPLSGQDPGELVGQPLVLAEQEADLAAADADVAGRHVGVRADVAVQLRHEALAETHHLVVAFALRIEVGAALAAAHRQGGEGVLEHLLEGQELKDAEIDRRVEPQAALVGSDGAVHLDAESPVDLNLTLVVDPGHPEQDDPLRLDDALENLAGAVLRMPFEHHRQGVGHLFDGLQKLGFVGVLGPHRGHQRIGNGIHRRLLFRVGRASGRLSPPGPAGVDLLKNRNPIRRAGQSGFPPSRGR